MSALKCELCGLEHMAGAIRCDACEHVLGQKVDLQGMQEELRRIKRRVAWCVTGALAMIAANLLAFRGIGMIYLTAPFAVAIHSCWRWRALSAHITHAYRS